MSDEKQEMDLARYIDELAMAYRAQFHEEPVNDVSILWLGLNEYLRRMQHVMETGDISLWYQGDIPLAEDADL